MPYVIFRPTDRPNQVTVAGYRVVENVAMFEGEERAGIPVKSLGQLKDVRGTLGWTEWAEYPEDELNGDPYGPARKPEPAPGSYQEVNTRTTREEMINDMNRPALLGQASKLKESGSISEDVQLNHQTNDDLKELLLANW